MVHGFFDSPTVFRWTTDGRSILRIIQSLPRLLLRPVRPGLARLLAVLACRVDLPLTLVDDVPVGPQLGRALRGLGVGVWAMMLSFWRDEAEVSR